MAGVPKRHADGASHASQAGNAQVPVAQVGYLSQGTRHFGGRRDLAGEALPESGYFLWCLVLIHGTRMICSWPFSTSSGSAMAMWACVVIR